MDYNVFILKFFEQFGIMLSTFRGMKSTWAELVTHWRKNYGVLSKEKIEDISEIEESKELIINYIENCSVVDNHIVKEGIICLKDNEIFIPTKIIKKLLKRNSVNLSMRKLAYILDDYLASGSIPMKIENKSERFWKFKRDKFDLSDERIETQEGSNEE